jgi:DNA-binding MarR family transcriptional regulator
MTQLVEQELAADGVAPDRYAMLSLIGARAPVRLTELARELGMPLTTASDSVRRLEQRRHVRRKQNPEDGRSSLLELTAAGDREWRRGWPALQRVNAALDEQLPDVEAVRDALDELKLAFESALTDD